MKRFGDAVAGNPALKNNPTLESLRKELLKEPLGFFKALRDQLQVDRETRPESLRRLGASAFELARLTVEIGDMQDALIAFREAQAISRKLVDANPADDESGKMLGSSSINIGSVLMATGKPAEALAALEQALAICRKLADDNPTVPAFQQNLANSLGKMGSLLSATGRPAEALRAFESGLAINQKLADDNPAVTEFRRAWRPPDTTLAGC